MLYLILTVLFSTLLIVIIHTFEKSGVNTFRGIIINYLVCALTGFVVMPNKPIILEMIHWEGLPYCIGLGCMFFFVFIMVGKTVKTMGITTASVAQKISFAIPVIGAIILYNQSINIFKIIGILLAISSVLLISFQKEKSEEKIQIKHNFYLPIIVFLGGGFCDLTFNYIQQNFYLEAYKHGINIIIFFCAFLAGCIVMLFSKNYQFTIKDIKGGILLGIPNYFSLFFLLLTLEKSKIPSSSLFPLINLGVVTISAILGYFIFKESFPIKKIIGLLLAICSILIIRFFG
ncbi:MAG: hypothetical protein IPN93_08840 [Bacteroidetes bacterium]|jgi:drug/metabolite transporter (DMT)-like permease|nr:hypothetical protein [Bacteroidota bacterium]MBK9633198.1 hypothetical protein [Bacteroidota bacterium]MBL0077656.1 hypothetical protein [Bacteroidota bacterium]MBL0286450.1 hypothetical protein [Bacteroidota bacterium]